MASEVELQISVEMQKALDEISKFSSESSIKFQKVINNIDDIAKNTEVFSEIIKETTKNTTVFNAALDKESKSISEVNNGLITLSNTLSNVKNVFVSTTTFLITFDQTMADLIISTDKVVFTIEFLGRLFIELKDKINLSNKTISSFVKNSLDILGNSFINLAAYLDEVKNGIIELSDNIESKMTGPISKGINKLSELGNEFNIFEKSISSSNKGFDDFDNSLNSIAQSKSNDLLIDNLKDIKDNTSGFVSELKIGIGAIGLFISGVGLLGTKLNSTTNAIGEILFGVEKMSEVVSKTTKVTEKFTPAINLTNKGLVNTSMNALLVGVGLASLGALIGEANTKTGKFTQTVLILSGTALVGLSVLLNETILLAGKFIGAIGTALVDSAIKATHEFIELDKSLFIYNRTLDAFNLLTKESTGSSEEWNKTILKLSESTGFSANSLRDATKEIVAALGPMGFTREELEKLLQVSTDYAAQVGGDVLQATLDFTSAINGNSQSILKYGVKLSDSNVQQHIFAEGINKNFESMSDVQKMTARYNTILDKHIPIAGAAVAVTTTLAGQQKLVDNNLSKLNNSFGAGSAIIENSNLINFGYNKILSNINSTVVESIGFIAALGGRVLQVTGFFLEWSVKISLAYKAYQLLNLIMDTNIFQVAMLRPIPIINKSLTELISGLAGSTMKISSLGDAATALSKILGTQLLLTLGNVAKGLKLVFLNPVFLTTASIVAGIVLVYEAFKTLEEKTGILTSLLDVLKESFSGLSPVLEEVYLIFQDIGDFAGRVLSTAFGLLVGAISNLIEVSLELVKENPFGIFEPSTVVKVEKISKTLNKFNNSLSDANYNITEMGSATSASLKKINKEMTEGSLKAVFALETELKKAGKTELQVATEVKKDRLKIIDDALKDGIILEGQYIKDKELIEIDFQKTVGEIRKKQHAEEISRQEKELEQRKKIFEYIKTQVQEAASAGGITGLIPGLQNPSAALAPVGITSEQTQQAQIGTQIGATLGLINTMLQGAEGTTKLITGVIGNIAEKFLPGIGGVVTEIFDVLSLGPDKVKLMITEFVSSIPVILDNIIQSIPALIEALINDVPLLIDAIVQGIPRIITAFILKIPSIITEIINNLPAFTAAIIEAAVAFTLYMEIVGPIWSAIVTASGVLWDIAVTASGALWNSAVAASGAFFTSVFAGIGATFAGIGAWISGAFSSLGTLFSNILPALGNFLGYVAIAAAAIVAMIALAKEISNALERNRESIQLFFDNMLGVLNKIFESFGAVVKKLSDVITYFGDVITNIANNIGPVFQKILDGLISLVDKILQAAVDLAKGVIDGIKEMTNLIYIGAQSFVKAIVEGAGNFVDSILKGAGDFISKLVSEISGSLGKAVSNATGGAVGGGGVDVVGAIGNAVGIKIPRIRLAKGGQVPSGFSGDNFPASLSSGEIVIPRGDVDRLSAFLDNQQNQSNNSSTDIVSLIKQVIGSSQAGQAINVTLQVGEKELANVILDLNRRGFRTV